MLETIGIIILVAAGVFIVTLLLFGGWVVANVIRLISRGVSGLLGVSHRRPAVAGDRGRRCPRGNCHVENIPSARFCRRCGLSLDADPRRLASARRSAW